MFEHLPDAFGTRRSHPFRPDPSPTSDRSLPLFGQGKHATVIAALFLGVIWAAQIFFGFSGPLPRITCVVLLVGGLTVAWRSGQESTWHALVLGFLMAVFTATQIALQAPGE